MACVYIDCNVQSGHIFRVGPNCQTNEVDGQTRSGGQKTANHQTADDTGVRDLISFSSAFCIVNKARCSL